MVAFPMVRTNFVVPRLMLEDNIVFEIRQPQSFNMFRKQLSYRNRKIIKIFFFSLLCPPKNCSDFCNVIRLPIRFL